MARGVSGALTRLAKTGAFAPFRSLMERDPGPPRRTPRSDDDDDLVFIQQDLEEISAMQQAQRRQAEAARLIALGATPSSQIPVAVAAPTVVVAPQMTSVANAAAAAPVAPAPQAPAPQAPAPVASAPGRRERRIMRYDDAPPPRSRWDEDEDEDDGYAAPVGPRLRRLRTGLTARGVGEARRIDEIKARPCTRTEEDEEREREMRASWRPKQLARLRRRLGMTQEEFARCYGLDVKDVARWEEGQRPGRSERILLTLIMHDPEEVARLVDEAMPFE